MRIIIASAVFILAVLLTILFFLPEEERKAAGNGNWPHIDPAKIQSIAVETPDSRYTLYHEDTVWYVDAPDTKQDKGGTPRADREKIIYLLQFIGRNMPVDRSTIYLSSRAEEYGLDKKPIVLTINGDSPWQIYIGAKGADENTVYGLSSRDPGRLLILDAKYSAVVGKTPEYYYDLRLLPASPESIVKVELKDANGVVWRIGRVDDGFAFILPESMISQAVSKPEMDLYLHTLTSINGVDYVFEPYAPQELFAEISVYFEKQQDATVVSLIKGGLNPTEETESAESKEESVYIAENNSSEPPLILPLERAEELIRTSFSLKVRDVLDISPGKIDKLKISHINESGKEKNILTAIKTDETWHETQSHEKLVGMDMLLWRLSEIQFEAPPQDVTPVGGVHVLTWRLFAGKERPEFVLNFYRDAGLPEDLCWLVNAEEGVYYPINDGLLEDISGFKFAGEYKQ